MSLRLHQQGQYGSGKSHLLDYMYSLALNNKYAVATVKLDPNEAPPSKPKLVYRKLIQSFRYKDGENYKDIRDFLRSFATRLGKTSGTFEGWPMIVKRNIGTPREEYSWNWMHFFRRDYSGIGKGQ